VRRIKPKHSEGAAKGGAANRIEISRWIAEFELCDVGLPPNQISLNAPENNNMSGAFQYPIAAVLSKIINESGLSQVEFVQRLGYPRAFERGLRRLRLWETGDGHERIIKEIIAVYPHHQEDLWDAIARTKVIKAAEAEVARKHATRHIEDQCRRRFKPFIWVHTEDGAHQFFTAIIERRVKVLWFGERFELLSEPEQLKAAQTRVRQHYARTPEYRGFGKVLSYTFVPTFDTSMALDTRGEVTDAHRPQFLLPEVWLELHP